jgi:hypothetical protein
MLQLLTFLASNEVGNFVVPKMPKLINIKTSLLYNMLKVN